MDDLKEEMLGREKGVIVNRVIGEGFTQVTLSKSLKEARELASRLDR